MIGTALITIAYYVIEILLFPFPSSDGFSSEVTSAISTIASYTTMIDALVPMDTLVQILLLVFAFEIAVFLWKGLRFFVSYLPFIGGRG